MREAVAFVNWGRWVADCPDPDCSNAEELTAAAAVMVCGFCSRSWPIVWPVDVALIDAALSVRPVPSTRNWVPGETVTDLLDENERHLTGVQ
jgi:hypothetical protein